MRHSWAVLQGWSGSVFTSKSIASVTYCKIQMQFSDAFPPKLCKLLRHATCFFEVYDNGCDWELYNQVWIFLNVCVLQS